MLLLHFKLILLLLSRALPLSPVFVEAYHNGLALTPQMGWVSGRFQASVFSSALLEDKLDPNVFLSDLEHMELLRV